MSDNDFNEQEEKSLFKEIAKKGISKTIKAIPLKTKLIIGGILFGIVFFLLIFIVLISPLIILFDDDSDSSSGSNLAYIDSNSEDNYWWPIGGSEVEEKDGVQFATGTPTSLTITSYYDLNRVIQGVSSPHPAIDIGGSDSGTDYVIASMKGTVFYVNDTCSNNGAFNVEGVSSCGGGFGNYIVIEHPGSVYTLYAHLYPNSIPVSVGDTVGQGQIIGIMGNSGNSTGTHLHFQLEVGGRSSIYAVNPLDYISDQNPRPVTIQSGIGTEITGDNQLLRMLQSWEGTGPTSGDNYIVYDDGYGYLTVGHGVTLQYNASRFSAKGINVSSLSKGSAINKAIVDSIELEIINEMTNSVESLLSNNGITLEKYQVDALVMRMYNVGNVNNFPNNYKTYGNSQALYDNFMSKPVTANGQYSSGLARRRQAEWKLFNQGIYTFNS